MIKNISSVILSLFLCLVFVPTIVFTQTEDLVFTCEDLANFEFNDCEESNGLMNNCDELRRTTLLNCQQNNVNVENTDPSNNPSLVPPISQDFNKIAGTGANATERVQSLIGKIISVVLSVLGSVAFIIFTGAGIMWMTAAGNASREEKAKDVIIWATLGIFVWFAAYAAVKFVFEIFV